jgi:ankyrin repeat protein
VDAAQENETEKVRMMMEAGVDVDSFSRGVYRAIDAATIMGHLDMVRLLLEAGSDVHATNVEGRTVLHHANDAGHGVELNRLLLDHGAEVNVQDKRGATPLHFAAQWADPEVLGLLLKRGADATARDADGLTPLDWSMRADSPEARKILEDHLSRR